ncbi:MAG: PilZ domain-containing protein [Proteobacteria bacterium]|nr:PilZ domain-containing protein [Pseudomonadota bacterium]
MDNHRRRSRVTTHIIANFLRQGSVLHPLVTQNISLKGMLAGPQAEIRTGELGVVRIDLSPEASIEIECQVIRSDAHGVAIDFKPMDEESFFHLRNLVRYNAPDADQIDAELKIPAFED